MAKHSKHKDPGPNLTPLVLIVAVSVLAVGLGIVYLSGTGSDSADSQGATSQTNEESSLPDYVLALGPRVTTAYQFAMDRPDVMLWMPCYCGCGEHGGHKNARDCFVKATSSSGNIQFDDHGSACDVCVDIALRAREMTLAGGSLSEIRAAVDQEFGDIGPGTDTPLPLG